MSNFTLKKHDMLVDKYLLDNPRQSYFSDKSECFKIIKCLRKVSESKKKWYNANYYSKYLKDECYEAKGACYTKKCNIAYRWSNYKPLDNDNGIIFNINTKDIINVTYALSNFKEEKKK